MTTILYQRQDITKAITISTLKSAVYSYRMYKRIYSLRNVLLKNIIPEITWLIDKSTLIGYQNMF